MKKIIATFILLSAVLFSGCASETQSGGGYINVTAGDFVFRVPEGAVFTDNSTDDMVHLVYKIEKGSDYYGFNIGTADKETGQKSYNYTIDLMENYGGNVWKQLGLTDDSSSSDEQEANIQKRDITSLGGKDVSLGMEYSIEFDDVHYIVTECFVDDKYYELLYLSKGTDDLTAWDNFLSSIKPL